MDIISVAAQNQYLQNRISQLQEELAYQNQTLRLLQEKISFYEFEYYPKEEYFIFDKPACRRYEFPEKYYAQDFIEQQVIPEDRRKVLKFLLAFKNCPADTSFKTDFLINSGMYHLFCICKTDNYASDENTKIHGIFTEQDITQTHTTFLNPPQFNYYDILLHNQIVGIYEFSQTGNHVLAIKSDIFKQRLITQTEFKQVIQNNYHPNDVQIIHDLFDSANVARWQDIGTTKIKREARRKINGSYRWTSLEFYLNQPGIPRRLAFLFIKDIHDAHLQNLLFSSLGSKYSTIFYINCLTGIYRKLEAPFLNLFTEQQPYSGQIDKVFEEKIKAVIHPDDSELVKAFFSLDHIQQAAKNHSVAPSIIYRKHNGKNYIWIESTYYHIQGDKEHIIIGNSDVTVVMERDKKMRENLSSALKDAKSANEAKSNFLSCMSHDIRTPLNAILGMGTIAERHISDPRAVSDCIQKIQSAGQHLLSLINDILDISKIEKNKIQLVNEEINLSSLLTDVLLILNPLISEKHHIFLIFVSNLKHEQIIADNMRIKQILINLLSNAIKYTPVGGLIKFTIAEEQFSDSDTQANYIFTITDNGIGMSEETLQKIFDPFVRAHDRRINNMQGTGLGMAITKSLIQLMQGSIHVESKLNEGSTFTVSIPFKKGNPILVSDEIKNRHLLFISDDVIECNEVADVFANLDIPIEILRIQDDILQLITKLNEYNYFAVILSKQTFERDPALLTTIQTNFSTDIHYIWFASAIDQNYDFSEPWICGILHTPLFKTEVSILFNKLLQNRETTSQSHIPDQKILKGRNVLVVDDNEINIEITHEFISSFGAHISIATNGQEAVNNVIEKPRGFFSMIFMDVQMPIMDGYEACKTIRKYEEDSGIYTPIIAMTADVFQEDIERIKMSGMDAHVAKPLDIVQLQKTVLEILRTKPQTIQN